MSAIDIIKDRTKQKKQARFLLIANGLIVSILIVWLTIGNLLVAYLEQPMLKAQADYIQRYPKREANASAIALRKLYSKLEIKDKIPSSLGDYLEHLRTTDNFVNPLPEDLKRYLNSKSITVNEIVTLLKQEPPKLENSDLSKAFTDPLGYSNASFLFHAGLQRVLLVEALQQYQSGQTQKVLDILRASWNLNLALQEQPSLISQLVAQILFSDLLAFLRKTSLPFEVQQLVKPQDYPKSFLSALELEILFLARGKQVPSSEFSQFTKYEIKKRDLTLLEQVLLPFQLPYFKLAGIDYWATNMQMLAKLQKQDICFFDAKTLQEETKAAFAWWNVSGRSQESYFGQWIRPYRKLIEWEFTQKILLAKASAAKTGTFPSAIQNVDNSTICKTIKYDYQVIDNGQKMTIQMQNLPKWFEYREWDLPVTFSFTLSSNQPPM
ncbi:hypothetical protein TUMEXPCC7403_11590 [Tumidithrix helvetica PCC 7403]|uniref:hypothetical protein n=1 Tax=Tumidithrix helvetica TaxID=3457545 RepID=UPI003CBEC3F5